MNLCIRCNKFLACEHAQEDLEECLEYTKKDLENEV